MEKCTHPESERESYHDNSVLCKACNCVIEQNGKVLSKPSQLGYIFPSSTSPGRYSPAEAYAQGWVAAAGWAKRNDLVSDIDSPAYLEEREDLIGE